MNVRKFPVLQRTAYNTNNYLTKVWIGLFPEKYPDKTIHQQTSYKPNFYGLNIRLSRLKITKFIRPSTVPEVLWRKTRG